MDLAHLALNSLTLLCQWWQLKALLFESCLPERGIFDKTIEGEMFIRTYVTNILSKF